jgi:hypothetical protein
LVSSRSVFWCFSSAEAEASAMSRKVRELAACETCDATRPTSISCSETTGEAVGIPYGGVTIQRQSAVRNRLSRDLDIVDFQAGAETAFTMRWAGRMLGDGDSAC